MRNKRNPVMKMATTQIRIVFVDEWLKIRKKEQTSGTTKTPKKN